MTEGISSATSSTSYLSMIQSTTEASAESSSSSKSTEEIITELKNDGLSSTKTAQDIADEYGVSLSKAQEILEELKVESGENYIREIPAPDGSTISYKVL